jgi:hypothetical protein
MANPIRLEFHIGAYTPETMPMARLAEYLADLAVILGDEKAVHLVGLRSGSVLAAVDVDFEESPKVLQRATDTEIGEGTAEAKRAKASIERKLAEDNSKAAELRRERGARILQFRSPAIEPPRSAYGPFNQPGELTGTVIMVGGQNDPVPVHLQDDELIHVCRVKRETARELAQYLFTTPVKVQGEGRWFRTVDGEWEMRSFTIASFVPLHTTNVGTIIQSLRSVKAKWLEMPDPLKLLASGDDK